MPGEAWWTGEVKGSSGGEPREGCGGAASKSRRLGAGAAVCRPISFFNQGPTVNQVARRCRANLGSGRSRRRLAGNGGKVPKLVPVLVRELEGVLPLLHAHRPEVVPVPPVRPSLLQRGVAVVEESGSTRCSPQRSCPCGGRGARRRSRRRPGPRSPRRTRRCSPGRAHPALNIGRPRESGVGVGRRGGTGLGR